MKYQGLFVGLTTLDCIYKSEIPLESNQKVVAQDYLTAAGGPATNAAVAFCHFGNQGYLLSVLGQHPLSQIIRSDLENYPIEITDLIPEKLDTPPVSSIIVTAATGERSIISINAVKSQGNSSRIPEDILNNIDIILVDGHQIEVSLALLKSAQNKQIPVVIDGGSWKPGFETILPLADYVICSANFFPPQCSRAQDVFEYLHKLEIPHIAITQGEQPIQYLEGGQINTISTPSIKAVDTLGAGDIFHGAFCHYILRSERKPRPLRAGYCSQVDFATALNLAGKIASKSCQFFGTRSWQDFV